MGLFRKNEAQTQEQETRPANPTNMVLIRVLAVGYLMYTLYNMITAYIAGGEDAPSLGLLIAAIVIFVGGSVWIGVISYKQYKQMKAAQQAAWEEEARLEAEAALLEENEEDHEDELDTGEDAEEEDKE